MKRATTIILVLAFLSMGCASPTIDTWADRGLQGVEFGKDNIDVFGERIRESLDLQKETEIDMFFNDILQVAEGKIDGVQIDEQWLTQHKAALKLFLAAWASDERTLRDAVAEAHGNLDSVAEAFKQIKRLRRSWGDPDDIGARLDYLTTIVTQLMDN